ncbi:MAG: LD-carboxypeptidase [Betaproteobacteria bacterium]|nr:LD-carboxypeptidase [Betaproteobacteria bacterium]
MYNKPIPLQPGATLGLFAPSGLINVERHEKSVAALEALGFKVVVAPEAFAQWRYFAGTDEERLAGFHHLLADPAIDALMMVRGGYGWSRLLNRVDWDLVARAKKPLIGFSDFTALSLGALAKSNLITFAGPGAAVDFGGVGDDAEAQEGHTFTDAHCWPMLRGEAMDTGPIACEYAYVEQRLEGPLWGSNLSLLSDLGGTPYFPDIEGGLLFVEEIGERPYAVERMFLHLEHLGVLSKQKAILLGAFTECDPEDGRFPYSMEHVIETLRERLSIPVLKNFPFGHVARKLTLPFGGQAELAISPGSYTLRY